MGAAKIRDMTYNNVCLGRVKGHDLADHKKLQYTVVLCLHRYSHYLRWVLCKVCVVSEDKNCKMRAEQNILLC